MKDKVGQISKLDVVKSWVKDTSPNTQAGYLNALAEFCMVNNIDPIQMIETIHMEEENRLPNWEKSINKWFERFDEYCKEKNHSKNTWSVRRSIVNGFIGFNGLTQYTSYGRRKSNGFKDPNRRKGLTKKDIRELLEASKSWKMKAIILTQVSSGISTADLIKLKVKDFQEGLIEVYDKEYRTTKKICRLKLVRQKTRKEFTTFLSEEAVKSIEKYLELDRSDLKYDDALFASYKRNG